MIDQQRESNLTILLATGEQSARITEDLFIRQRLSADISTVMHVAIQIARGARCWDIRARKARRAGRPAASRRHAFRQRKFARYADDLIAGARRMFIDGIARGEYGPNATIDAWDAVNKTTQGK